MIIRPAVLGDAPGISFLVNQGAREGQLLPRALESVCATIGDWVVAKRDGQIIGCGSLVEMGSTLSEIRSLAVTPQYRKNGIGRRLVEALIELARDRNIQTVFALTRAVPFFEKIGFQTTVKDDFPEKVWRDCIICPVQVACDEVAVVYQVAREPLRLKSHEKIGARTANMPHRPSGNLQWRR